MSDAGRRRLSQLMARGCDFLGTDAAILGGALSWVSERHLVSAISNAGGFGVIACGAMSPELLDAEIAGTKALTQRPFGRSEERREGKGCVSTGSTWWAPQHEKKK